MTKQLCIKCPRCRTETDWHANPSRPFCSERCRLIDLGAWMDGAYSVPTDERGGEAVDDPEDHP